MELKIIVRKNKVGDLEWSVEMVSEKGHINSELPKEEILIETKLFLKLENEIVSVIKKYNERV